MSIPVIDTLNSIGDFPLAKSEQIQVGDKRLNAVVSEIQSSISTKTDKTYVDTELANKVDKVNGKGLSANDYTTSEKTKLAGIADGATNVTVDSDLSTTSTNAVQNKVAATAINSKAEKTYVDTEIAKKVDKENGKGLSTNDYTTSEKTKLAGIATGATKVTVDDTLVATSTNAIQNKAVTSAINLKADNSTVSALSNRVKTYEVTSSMSYEEIQSIFSISDYKIVFFSPASYSFSQPFRLNKNTEVNFCGSTITFTCTHGFFNFLGTDEPTVYGGNGNITLKNGIVNGGAISFCHAKNINFDNLVFRNILNNHVIEIAACCDFRVTNCDFAGTVESSSPSKFESECVQIDYMNYESFPWFDDENNPAYDITPNKNIEVSFCKFEAVLPSTLNRCVGSHQYDTNTLHTNILIHDNEFVNPTDSAISVTDYKGCYINNNIFKYTSYPNSYNDKAGLITLCDLCYDINIYDNHFYGGVVAVRGLYPVRDSMTVTIHDNMFEDYMWGSDTAYGEILKNVGIILAPNASVVEIKNNNFKKFNRRCIGGADNVGSKRTKLLTTIANNTFEYSESNTVQTISLYAENQIITGNNFIVAKGTTPTYESNFRCYAMHKGNYICDNNFDKYFNYNNKKYALDSDADMSGNKDATINLLNQIASSGTYTLSRNYTEYNTLKVIVGGASDTNVITLHGYNFPNALDARDYRFVVFSNEGNIVTGTITLSNDNQITIAMSSDEIRFQKCFGMNV